MLNHAIAGCDSKPLKEAQLAGTASLDVCAAEAGCIDWMARLSAGNGSPEEGDSEYENFLDYSMRYLAMKGRHEVYRVAFERTQALEVERIQADAAAVRDLFMDGIVSLLVTLKRGPGVSIEVELGPEIQAWRGPHYSSVVHSDPNCGSRGLSALKPVAVNTINDQSHHYAYEGRVLWGCGTCGLPLQDQVSLTDIEEL